MKHLFFDDANLKTYSAASKGGKSTIKIEIETTDHFELAYMLRQLGEIEAAQKAPKKPEPAAKKAEKPLALPAPPLALPYYPGDE